MLLTKHYRLVTASNDISGWLTPDGKHLKYLGSHTKTFKAHGIDIEPYGPTGAIRQGYTWLNVIDGDLYCSTHYSKYDWAKRKIASLLGDSEIHVSFELFNDSGKRVKDIDSTYRYGEFREREEW